MLKRLLFSISLIFMVSVAMAADKKFTLVIDAGHGGKDAGAVGAISKEKNINLAVALAFGRYVERNCPDVKVVYTRKTDVFVELQERANIANRNKADLFVSVHTNAIAGSKVTRGFETYTLGMHRAGDNLDVAKRENSVITLESDYKSKYQGFDPNSAESYIMFEYMQDKNMENSVKFAKAVQSNVCSTASRLNKGVHQAGFLVLRQTSMPSCLIELGFISTPDEERQLNDPSVQDRMARGIYLAFQNYRGKKGSTAVEPVAETTVPTVTALPQEDKKVEPLKPAPVAKSETTKDSVKTTATKQEIVKTEPATPVPVKKESEKKAATDEVPTFKVQILTASRIIKSNDKLFKGLENVEYYKENGMYKYTYGASTNYSEIAQLRKSILEKFPEAFVIAFKGSSKVNVTEAIQEWRAKRK